MDNFLGYNPLQTGMGQQGLQNINTPYTTQQVSSEAILELQPGDTFQGEIMSVNGQDVQLQLTNGLYMAARLEGDVQLALGQLLTFQVQSNQNSKIVLKPIYTNLLQQRVGEAALKEANLAVNDKNLQMVARLIENGMPIDKSSLALFNRQLLQHPQVNIESLIRLQQLGVKLTDANLTQLSHYRNMEHKLFDGIKDVVKDIGKLYDTIAAGNTETAVPATGQSSPLVKAGDFMEQVLRLLTENVGKASGTQENVQGTMENPQGLPNQDMALKNMSETVQGLASQGKTETTQGMTAQATEGTLHGLAASGNAAEKAMTFDTNAVLQVSSQNDSAVKLAELMKQLEGLPEEQTTDKIQSRDKLFRSEQFRELLKDTLQNEWSLSPEELTEDGKIKEFYQKILQQSQKLSQIMEQAMAQNRNGTGDTLQNIRENVEFMNQMNQMFQYVQLPLKLKGSQAQGELYVYTNKRNLAKKDGMLTAILHLDMEYLGNLDINIALNTNNGQVATKFYPEEDSVALLLGHMEELTERLVKKGYQSQTFVEKRISEKTVFEQIEEQADALSAPLVYQNFDIRM